MSESDNSEVTLNFGWIKTNWPKILLILILIFGFYLRFYHVDYPVIGYHNWKETHYLTEARNFARDGDWLTPRGDFPDLLSNPKGAHGDSLPLSSWFTGIGFLIFGLNVWVGRAISILFVMGVVLLLYLITKKLFKREDIALTTALVASTNPLLVFFGRQVQLINPALFFGLLSIYLYLIWLKDNNKNTLFFAVLCFTLSFLTKYSFAILAMPMIALFPFKKLKNKEYIQENFKSYLYAAIPLSLVPLWFINNYRIASLYPSSLDATKSLLGAISFDPLSVFQSGFRSIMKSYLADNYTLIGIFFAFLGIILFFIFSKRKGQGYKFVMVYLISVIPWVFIMGKKLSGHSYHQYPIAPLVIILISLSFVLIGSLVEKLVKVKTIRWFVIIVLFLFLMYPPFFSEGGGIIKAKDRQFDTNFYGLDIAGDYIQMNSNQSERILFSEGQTYGLLWHADRKGYAGIPNLGNITTAEDNLNVSWIFLYQSGLSVMNDKEKWDYIKQNYSLRQIGYIISQNGPQLIYMLFEKGGSFDETSLQSVIDEKQKNNELKTKEYSLSGGKVNLVYFNFDK